MTNIKEILIRFNDFLDSDFCEDYYFDTPISEKHRLIMDEICDCAENSGLFQGFEVDPYGLSGFTARQTYIYMVGEALNARTLFEEFSVIFSVFPLVRCKMIAEGIYKAEEKEEQQERQVDPLDSVYRRMADIIAQLQGLKDELIAEHDSLEKEHVYCGYVKNAIAFLSPSIDLLGKSSEYVKDAVIPF